MYSDIFIQINISIEVERDSAKYKGEAFDGIT